MKIYSIGTNEAKAKAFSKQNSRLAQSVDYSACVPTFTGTKPVLNKVKTSSKKNFWTWLKGLFTKKAKVVEPPKPELTPTQKLAERLLKTYGINGNFDECLNVAEFTEKTAKIMGQVFGKDSLPATIEYKIDEKNPNAMGVYLPYNNGSINFNKIFHEQYFKTKAQIDHITLALKANEAQKKQENFIHIKDNATIHPFSIFIHEFAHSAHFSNIVKNNGYSTDAGENAWVLLNNRVIPSHIGRFITKFKLGKYSATNMCELMAEKITQDICKYTNNNGDYFNNTELINYSNIFDRNWNCRFSCPQAYLDYYIQQIWSGKTEQIKIAEDLIDVYLKEVERQEAKRKQANSIGIIDFVLGKIRDFGGSITKSLSRKLDNSQNIQGRVQRELFHRQEQNKTKV